MWWLQFRERLRRPLSAEILPQERLRPQSWTKLISHYLHKTKVILIMSTFLLILGFFWIVSLVSSAPPPSGSGNALVLSGDPAAIGPGTYPRAIEASDGSLIGTLTVFEGDLRILTTVQSTDQGRTWKKLGEIARGTNDIDNAVLLELPNGHLLSAFRNNDGDPSTIDAAVSSNGDQASSSSGGYTSNYSYFRITVCSSDDGGRSWTYLSEPASDPGPVTGLWEPFLRLARDGTVQLYYAREVTLRNQEVLMRTSSDNGATWSGSSCVSGTDKPFARDGMPGVAEFRSGDKNCLITVFERGQRSFTVDAVISADDGASWSSPQLVYKTSGLGRKNAAAPQVLNVDGTLYVSFATDEDSGTRDWPNLASVKLVQSQGFGDGCQINGWGNKVTVNGPSSYWAGVVGLKDPKKFLVLYEQAGSKSQMITTKKS
ncbi:MAG: hypothetical protein M1837_000213 [Sclerophora amabilis]|nr:MAG: hypothetical protein M1837_000213 [Sclerophora amabilis]